MAKLLERIAALEERHGVKGRDLTVTIKRFGSRAPGEPPASYSTLEPDARRVHRDPGEADEAFHERALKVLRGMQRGLLVMLED